MTYAHPQDHSDRDEAEKWYAALELFQDVVLGNEGLTAPPPNEAQGRLYLENVLRELERMGIVDNVRQLENGRWTYSQLAR